MKGSVTKRGAKWSVVFDAGRDPDTGKRIQKRKGGFRIKKEAEAYLVEKLNELEKGLYYEAAKMSFGEYLVFWLETMWRPIPLPKQQKDIDTLSRT